MRDMLDIRGGAQFRYCYYLLSSIKEYSIGNYAIKDSTRQALIQRTVSKISFKEKFTQQSKIIIQEQVLFPLQSEFNPNRLMLINISDLNSERLVKPFVIFEVLQLNFVE